MAQQHFETAFSENLIRKWSGKWREKKKNTFKTSKTLNIHTLTAHLYSQTPIPVIFPQCCKDSSQKHCEVSAPQKHFGFTALPKALPCSQS